MKIYIVTNVANYEGEVSHSVKPFESLESAKKEFNATKKAMTAPSTFFGEWLANEEMKENVEIIESETYYHVYLDGRESEYSEYVILEPKEMAE